MQGYDVPKQKPFLLENSEVESAQEVFIGHESQIIWGYSHMTHRNIIVILDANRESNISGMMLIRTVVFILNIPGTFITFYIYVGCCTECISQQKHFCIANEYQS